MSLMHGFAGTRAPWAGSTQPVLSPQPHHHVSTATPNEKLEVKLLHFTLLCYKDKAADTGVLQLVLHCGKGRHFHSLSLGKQGSPFHNPASGFLPSDELPATAVIYHPLQGDHTRQQRTWGDAEPHPAAGFAQSHVWGSAPPLACRALLGIRSPVELRTSSGNEQGQPTRKRLALHPKRLQSGVRTKGVLPAVKLHDVESNSSH